MATGVQVELWPAEKVAAQATVQQAANGIRFAAWGETRLPEPDLEKLVAAVPATLSAALSNRAYYFVPLAIADTGETLIAPSYTVELGDRAICHRNQTFGTTEAVFLSTRLVEDRFGLAFEFFINVAHNFITKASKSDWSEVKMDLESVITLNKNIFRLIANQIRVFKTLFDLSTIITALLV